MKIENGLGKKVSARAKKLDKILCAIYDPHGEKDNLTDILTDLRHLADSKGYDFFNCDRIAQNHYTVERTTGDIETCA